MKNKLFTTLLFLCSFALVSAWSYPPYMFTQSIRFTNTGSMNVSGAVFVGGDMRMMDDPVGTTDSVAVVIRLNDTIHLTGSFFHDATGNVFEMMDDTDWSVASGRPRGVTSSTGTIRFIDESASLSALRPPLDTIRFISATSPIWGGFDRTLNYIAFPNLEISTSDMIFVYSTMGIDANTIRRTSGYNGALYLTSDTLQRVPGNRSIYTASLRVVSSDVDAADVGAVIVEQHVQQFRDVTDTGAATMLLPFASPFTHMRAGVFAGNWVRRPQIDAELNSFRFPYGNESADSININRDQYVRGAYDILNPAEGHLIRLRRRGASYAEYTNITSGDSHELETFVFGTGQPWQSMAYQPDGSLVTGVNLLANRSTQTNPGGLDLTQNWVVGNSFTSGLDGQAIAEYLMTGLPDSAYFMPYLFIFPHGATSYQTYPIWDGSSVPQGVSDIQAMGVFMIAAWSGPEQAPGFTPVIDSRFQVHTGGISANSFPVIPDNPLENNLRSARAQNSVLNFVLTPENNPFVFSRTSIRLNENADLNSDNHNVHALRNASNQLFHLYGTNRSREVLQQNVLPYTAPLAMLSVSPSVESMAVVLRVEGAENFSTEVVELYDRQTGQRQDLRANNSYWFVMNPGDNADRFEVHFRSRVMDVDSDNLFGDWQAYSFSGELLITNLRSSYQGSQLRIHNASGILHIQQPIANVPEERINISSLPAGVYLLSIEGRTVKFIK